MSTSSPAWERVTSIPPLPPSAVHVWLDTLDDDGARPWASGQLSAEESRRAAGLRVPARRIAFVRGRALLRHVAAGYLDRPSGEIAIDIDEHGKPLVRAEPGATALDVSISHSERMLMVAVSRAGAVGVDVEHTERAIDRDAIVRRFFAPEEAAAMAACAAHETNDAFYRCWTRKEAVVKAIGAGLACPLTAFAVSVSDVPVSGVLHASSIWTGGTDWRLYDVSPGGSYAGALAVRGSFARVRCLRPRPDAVTRNRG